MINKLLQQLVQIPSQSGNEEELAGFVLAYLKKHNLPAKLEDGNVILHIPGKHRDKALIFTCHLDTVVPGNISDWNYPPTGKKSGQIKNGRVYGLGASDDKGGLAAMLFLATQIKNPASDLWFVFVIEEETTGNGTFSFLKRFKASKYFNQYEYMAAVIGEPTGLSMLEIGHRGNLFLEITANGKSGHSAASYQPEKLAVEKMLEIISAFQSKFILWQEKYQHPALGQASFNITGINTGSNAPNQIPGCCRAGIDVRTVPSFEAEITRFLNKLATRYPGIKIDKSGWPFGYTDPKSRLVQSFVQLLPGLPLTISLGSTDLCQFTGEGIEAVCFGPGEKTMMHKTDEYCILEKVNRCMSIYSRLVNIL